MAKVASKAPKEEIPAAKAAISPIAALKEIKSKKFSPVYFLEGKEKYFIDAIADAIEANALTEGERSFNQVILYGRDTDMATVLNNARKFPMMAERNLVIIREAHDFADLGKEDKAALLINYLKKPTSSTVLVIAYKGKSELDKRKNISKAIKAYATCVACEPIKDEALPEFITQQLANYQLTPDTAALQVIIENVGNNLQRLAKEMEKLAVNIPQGGQVSKDQVYEFVGISRDYNNFEFQKALANKQIEKANKILTYFNQHEKEFPLVANISFLYGFFSKVLIAHSTKDQSNANLMKACGTSFFGVNDILAAISKYPLSKTIQIMHYLREADLRSKGVDNSGFISSDEILRELAFKILH